MNEQEVEMIARVCHEVNRVYCQTLNEDQPEWGEAPEWQRESAREGVRAILENPEIEPEQSHEGWMRVKLAAGWSYGPIKDPEAKTHPCILPYRALPESQRMKDVMFVTVVKAFLNLRSE